MGFAVAVYAAAMTTPAIDIDRLSRPDVNTSIAVATRAFWDDPMFNFFTPDLLAQHKNLVGLFAGFTHDCAEHGEVWVAKLGPTLAGVAAWLPPGVFPATGGTRALRQGLRVAPSILRGRQRRTAYKLLNEMTARHPHEEHWYLTMLATDPLYQGRGIGKALVEPMLARADETGVATYLETQKESNLAYYQRFGFEIVDKFSVNASPPLWQMQREPR
jgi:ribosomal protein S18 acetylase RimI-like enzyme